MHKISGFPVEKIYLSNRKTIAIEVTDNATLIIKAPRHVTKKDLETIINNHSNWIRKRLEISSRSKLFTEKKFVPGEQFLYLGQLYKLKFNSQQTKPLILDQQYFLLKPKYKTQAREIFINWYKRQAQKIFYQRAQIFAPLLGVQFNSLKLSSARKRWGSCSSKGNINIVWRLIMAPLSIIDYVIVHELAHLRYMDHSKSFWRLVGQVYPQYTKARNWLKEYGNYLDI